MNGFPLRNYRENERQYSESQFRPEHADIGALQFTLGGHLATKKFCMDFLRPARNGGAIFPKSLPDDLDKIFLRTVGQQAAEEKNRNREWIRSAGRST